MFSRLSTTRRIVSVRSFAMVSKPTLPEKYGNFINGNFQDPIDGQYFDNISPIDGKSFIKAARSNQKVPSHLRVSCVYLPIFLFLLLYCFLEYIFVILHTYFEIDILHLSVFQFQDITMAVDAADEALKTWKNVSVTERSNMLLKIADIIEQNLETLATLESMDNGEWGWT